MNHLRQLYEQWGALTDEEGRAIRAADWTKVAACQSEKLRLQGRIQPSHSGWQIPAQRVEVDPDLRVLVEDLILRERKNNQALEEQRQLAEARTAELDQAHRQLKQVHQAYAPGSPSLWQSYS